MKPCNHHSFSVGGRENTAYRASTMCGVKIVDINNLVHTHHNNILIISLKYYEL